MIADLLPQRIRKVGGVRGNKTMYAAFDLNAREPVGIGDWQTAQPHSVHELKNTGVDADAERQCQYGGNGEAGTFAQRADRHLHILKGRLEPTASAGIIRATYTRVFSRGQR